MTRFIIIVFGFLAFAFYELSGGSDFDAEETRMARIDAPTGVSEQTLTTDVADASVAAPIKRALPENVTRVALNLETVDDVLRPTPTLRTKPAVQRTAPAPDAPVSEEEPTIVLPSLLVDTAVITPVDFNDDSTVQTAGVTGTAELRSVTGRSVNVRGGPGTDYSIVNRLVRGDQVEILQDPGDGWVQLRPVGGGSVGWMADFLLSEG